MDPSHARKYTNQEVEVVVSKILSQSYTKGIVIPIDIDLLVERNETIDSIIPADLLQDKFNVAAVLNRKPNGHFDIFVDEDAFISNTGRASFSIAHEFGHIILHGKVFCGCEDTDDVITLNTRIEKAYQHIERKANYFAGAILIPLRTIQAHTANLYEGLTKEYGYDINLIPYKLCANLAKVYKSPL